jgi:c-di-GMP-binding flagellar brake protein YcgR
MPEDKRRFVRLNVLVDVAYSKIPPSEKEKLSVAKNIGKGGICLIAYEELRASDMLNIEMFLPEGERPINAVGRVAWTKEFIIGDAAKGKRFDVGIEFIKIDDKDADKINKYVFTHFK